ncbi:MAG: hypothetical protein COC12_07875 [Rhodobacteraceae bacterium]|nr:MAG: hypothetical protein COC12_07875 [Paracoccaceae bacterium]
MAQGPEEKRGFSGRVAGCEIAINATLPDKCPSLGRGVPRTQIRAARGLSKSQNVANPPLGVVKATTLLPIGNLKVAKSPADLLVKSRSLF